MAKKARNYRQLSSSHLIILFVALITVIVLIIGDGQLFAKGPPKTAAPSSVQISVVAPNGGEALQQAQANTISWKGGYRAVAVGLATADADTNHAIAMPSNDTPYSGPQTNGTTGSVIGFIKTTENGGVHMPNSSIVWDGVKVCNFHLNMDPDVWCKNVAPGNYKIFVWSEGQGGQSMCIGSGEGPTGKYIKGIPYGCNWDLSNQPFTIVAP